MTDKLEPITSAIPNISYKQENLIPVSFDDIKDKFKLFYSAKDDCIVIDLCSNLVIHSDNTLLASKGDTVILSGTSGTGNIHLNPSSVSNLNKEIE